MRRVAVRGRAGHDSGDRDPLRRKPRSRYGRPAPPRTQSSLAEQEDRDGAQLDDRIEGRLDDRLDGQLDAAQDTPRFPRYLPDAAPASPPGPRNAGRPAAVTDEDRAQRKKLRDPPSRDASPVLIPMLPMPMTAVGPLMAPLAPLPQATPLVRPSPPSLEKAEAREIEGRDKSAPGGKDKPGAQKTVGAKDKAEKPKTKDAKDAKKESGKKGGTAGAAAGGKGAAQKSLTEEDGEEETAIEPDPAPPEEPTALEVPLDVEAPVMQAEWNAPDSMADGVIPDKPRMSPAAEQAGKEGKPEEKRQAADETAAHERARGMALRAYADLTQTARSKQRALLSEVSDISNYMANAYGMTANEITHAHDNAIASIDAEAERQCTNIEVNTGLAELELKTAHDSALQSIRAAAGGAFGTINANDKATTALITKNVGSLKSEHQGKFNEEKEAYDKVVKKAVTALKKWSAESPTIYPIATIRPLLGAQHEKFQPRVVAMAAARIKEIGKGCEETIKAWTSTSENSQCTVGCSYQFALDQARTQTFEAGRKAVSKALAAAKKGLAKQLEQGLLNLRRMRQASLTQVRNQQRNSRSTLTSQARATLNGARRNAQGALGSVQSSTRGSLPGYWRALSGFEQSMRMAAPGGAAAINKTAETAATPIVRGIDNSTTMLRRRLLESRERLDGDQAKQQTTLREQREQHITVANVALANAPESFTEQAAAALTKFNEGAGQLATSVSDAAQSFASKPEKLFKVSFEASRKQAEGSLNAIFTGGGDKKKEDGKPPPDAAGTGPTPDCSGCKKEGGEGAAGAGDAKGGESKGIIDQRKKQEESLKVYDDPKNNAEFTKTLASLGGEVAGEVKKADMTATAGLDDGIIDVVNEGKVTGALRGLTAAKGRAVDQRNYPDAGTGPTLSRDMLRAMGADDESYKAAIHYLNGETLAGAKLELEACTNWYNDQEGRIEEVMRALSPEMAAEIGADKKLFESIHGALDGTDAKVFEVLAKSDPKKRGAVEADALRMRDKVDSAKREGDHDAVHAAEVEFTTMRGNDWNSKQLENMEPAERKKAEDEHRLAVAAALGKIVTEEDPVKIIELAGKTDAEKQAAYTQTAVDFVTRDVQVLDNGGSSFEVKNARPGDPAFRTIKMEGANRDMATALLLNGKDSAEARAAKIGVEIERKGDDAKAENVDEAVYDARFMPLPKDASDAEKKAHDEEVAKARELRAKTLLLAAEKYAGGKAPPKDYKTDTTKSLEKEADPHVAEAQQKLISKLAARFEDDKVGAQFVTNLIKEERPSAKTASLAMQYAMYSHSGTNEELMYRYPERMTRDEIKEMKDQFKKDTGDDFEEEAGLYGKGSFAELSGDDALRMERAMLGVARTEQEKAEAAAFQMQQQRRETGALGKDLAKGSYGEAVLDKTESGLYASLGVGISAKDFTREGTLKPEAAARAFNSKGEYIGKDRDRFMANMMTGQLAAETYQAGIDKWANAFTTGIAILGAIVAAVLTGGAALPLIACAVVTGLASMAVSYAIKGGRYGWEQAAVDLGMTAVQAVTAGVGAKLGAAMQLASKGAAAASQASRTLMTLSKIFTGNPIVDQIIVGAITGSIGGLAGAAFDEKTWEKGSGDAVSALFGGLVKGALAGGATAALTSSIEALGRNGAAIAERAKAIAAQGGLLRGAVGLAGRGVGTVGIGIGKALAGSTGGGVRKSLVAMGTRGLARGTIAGLGGMAGRSTEILFDKATGKYKGGIDDALADIGQAGLHSAVQGFGEGAGEAVGQGLQNRRLANIAKAINDERAARNLPPLTGNPHDPHTPLGAAADDLLFMNHHGKNGSDGLGQAINLDHVVTHGGMAHTVATQHPDATAVDAMRAELMRHVPESLHGEFADVPIRVLSEAEYRALTRSESGPVVTLIENGKPVVVIRAGAELAHLANEGPHLLQTADAATKPKVARLDESVLAHWDKLDVDTQVDLYKNKIDLEIDAHQRIADALEAKIARGDGDPVALAIDQARNEHTLANLHARQEEVGNITPSQRKAMQDGELAKPQYLEQPARLFSKGKKYDGRGRYTEQDAFGDEVDARRGPTDDAEDDHPTLPDTPPRGRPEDGPGGRMFGPSPDELASSARRMEQGNEFNIADNARMGQGGDRVHDETRIDREGKTKFPYDIVDATVPGKLIVERKHTQLAEIGAVAAIDYINELVDIYRPGKTIANTEKNRKAGIAGKELSGEMILRVPEQLSEVPHKVLQHAADSGVTIQDPSGRKYTLEHPGGDDGVKRASASEPEIHADDMQKHLMRHVDPATAAALGDVPISVLPAGHYDNLTGAGAKGPVVTMVKDGKPFVVIREGTPIHRLADEGPHLRQTIDESTSAKVAKLEESKLANWHKLDVDEQLDLYKTKIELEIDAHKQIRKSLEAQLPHADDIKAVLADIDRNERTLANLNRRRREVERITPQERAEMQSGAQTRKKYLEHPPRLFSKDPSGEIVFEPFVGPGLKSPKELQERYPGARVIAAEQSEGRIPSAKDVAEFEAGGGKFIADRFGAGLPDNSVDTMHVRYPLPHEKAQETMLNTVGKSFAEIVAEANAHQAAVESVTNLAPHALRTLRPGGEIEIVFHENSIASEINRACQREWTDEKTGRRYRLEPTGEARMVSRKEIAPHSGHGIPAHVTEVQVVTLRKTLIPRTPEEIAAIDAARVARKQEKRQAREEKAQARTQREEAEQRRNAALEERTQKLDAETAKRVQDLQEGRVTLDEDLRQRLAAVADEMQMPVDQLASVIQKFHERFGGSGRRYEAQDVIDSLRARTRDGRAPRFDDLDGLVHEMALELNVIAVKQLREQIIASQPDVVLGVERGGAFLAEVLARGVADFPEAKAIPKHVEEREGQEPAVRRTPHLEAEIRRRITELDQKRFAIVDFYMGGVFADELHAMIKAIIKDHPYVEFEVMWMRESFGFERVVIRPTRADLEEGVAFVGRLKFEGGRLKVRMESPGVTLPPLRGVDPDLPQLHATQAPVDIVLGDDMPSVLANDSKAPVRIFDNQGRIVAVIPVGTPDPETGKPLDDTREIVRRLMQGAFGDLSRSGGKP